LTYFSIFLTGDGQQSILQGRSGGHPCLQGKEKAGVVPHRREGPLGLSSIEGSFFRYVVDHVPVIKFAFAAQKLNEAEQPIVSRDLS
jgi:hypothetical protein